MLIKWTDGKINNKMHNSKKRKSISTGKRKARCKSECAEREKIKEDFLSNNPVKPEFKFMDETYLVKF
jgi:hypothetical protein